MFDKYAIVDGSLRNVSEGGSIVGWAIDTRITYYRGLGLSMVDVALEVDGQAVPISDITITVHGNTYPADGLAEIFDDRWGFNEAATLTVKKNGGLAPGSHSVHFTESLRVSYAPSASVTHDTKSLEVA
jgi:hypothetical protein